MTKFFQKSGTFSTICVLFLLAICLLTWKAWHQSVLNQTLIQALRNHDHALVIASLKQGADPNWRSELVNIPTGNFQMNGQQVAMAQPSLLDIILHREPNTLFPVLMLAAFNGEPENVKALLDAGANVNSTMPSGSNAEGYTALIYASGHPSSLSVKILLEHGANANQRTSDGKSALDFAKALKYKDTIQLLKAAGATE